MSKIRRVINMRQDKKERGAFLVLVIVIYALIYLPIHLRQKMYIYLDIGADTYSSYWPLYGFLWDYVRKPVWSQWSFQMGLGNAIVSSTMFLLDPYNLFLLPFDKYNLDAGIFLVLTAKVFSLATLAFLYFKNLGYRGWPLVAGALSYTFCGYFVGWGQHYHFATAFVLFSLILLSLEIWLQTGKWLWLVLAVAIMATFSAYFLFMSLLFLSLYYVFRLMRLRRYVWGDFLRHGFITFLLVLFGMLLAAFSLLPQVSVLTQSPRVGWHIVPRITFASGNEYFTIVSRLLSNNLLNVNSYFGYRNFYESPFLYTGVLTLVMLSPVLFLKKKYYYVAFFIALFCLLFPSFSNALFNGFSNYTYRWTFILVPILTNGLAIGMKSLDQISIRRAGVGALMICLTMLSTYGAYYKLIGSPRLDIAARLSLIGVVVFFLIYLVLMLVGKVKIATLQGFFTLLLAGELSYMGYITVNIRSLVDISEKSVSVPYFDHATNAALAFIKGQDDGVYRVNKLYDFIHLTDSLYQNFYGEKYYSSTMPVYIWELQDLFGLRGSGSNYLYGFLDSQSLRDTSAVKYMLSKTHEWYAGYDYMTQVENVYVYRNRNALPLTFVYEQYMPLSEFKALSMVEREDVIYEAVILPDNVEGISNLKEWPVSSVDASARSIRLNLAASQGFLLNNGRFHLQSLKKETPYLEMSLENPSTSSIYFYFSANLKSGTGGIVEVSYKTKTNEFNTNYIYTYDVVPGKNDYNITIPAIGIEKIRISFPNIRRPLVLKDFVALERDDEKIANLTKILKDKTLNFEMVNEDYIRGFFSLKQGGFLYFSIPYNKGWKLYIDGIQVDLIKANIAFMGAVVPAGNHSFELKYSTPLLREGGLVSCLFLMILLVMLYLDKRRFRDDTSGMLNGHTVGQSVPIVPIRKCIY